MKQPISIVRGTTNFFHVYIQDQNGEPYTLDDMDHLVFGIKANPMDSERIFTKDISQAVGTTADGGAIYLLELYPSETRYFDPGKYFYDIGLQVGTSQFYIVVETSVFEVKPNITELGGT